MRIPTLVSLVALSMTGCATNAIMDPVKSSAAKRSNTVLSVRPMGGAYVGVDFTPGIVGLLANVAHLVRSVEQAAADRTNFQVSVAFLGRNLYGDTCMFGAVEVAPTDAVKLLKQGDKVMFVPRADGQQGFEVQRLLTTDGAAERMTESDPCWRLRPQSMRD